jgi:hypothetical protein
MFSRLKRPLLLRRQRNLKIMRIWLRRRMRMPMRRPRKKRRVSLINRMPLLKSSLKRSFERRTQMSVLVMPKRVLRHLYLRRKRKKRRQR